MSLLNKLTRILSKAPSTTSTTSTSAAPSASRAKERLSVILASQRNSDLMQHVNMEALQTDVMQVLQRHIQAVKSNRGGDNNNNMSGSGSGSGSGVNGSMVSCNMRSEGDVTLFEMSVEIDGIQNYGNTSINNARTNTNTGVGGTRTRNGNRR